VSAGRPAAERHDPAGGRTVEGGRAGGPGGWREVAGRGRAAAGGACGDERDGDAERRHRREDATHVLQRDDGSWRLPLLAGVVALAVTAGGLALERAGHELGTPTPPFLFPWAPDVRVVTLGAAVALFAAVVAAVPRLLHAPRFVLWSFALALALRMACAAARDGTGGWTRAFDPARSFEAKNEYLFALGALRHGPAHFLDRFAEVVPALPVHAAGHPPGLLLTIDALSLGTPERLATSCLLAGALVAPLTYLLGRRLLAERQARIAALLVAACPAMLTIGATSADAVFATLGAAAALALVTNRVAGAAALAVASQFSWSLLAVGAWAVVLRGRRGGVVLALACALALVAYYGALALATGYDHLGTLAATEQVYGHSIARIRPAWYWTAGSPVAFAVLLGLPTTAYALRARGRVALAIAIIVAVAALSGFTKAETERIWLFLVPFACLAAATVLPTRRVGPVVAVLLTQALAVELLFDTVW
jgi:hypothetical protein